MARRVSAKSVPTIQTLPTLPSARRVADAARRELASMSRPVGEFDASRYFRGGHDLQFFNVGSPRVRALARRIVGEHPEWTVAEAMAFAEALMPDPVLEVKGLAVEVVARYRRTFKLAHLTTWKRWLASDYAANWATTDAMCGMLIGLLLIRHPDLADRLRSWSRSRNLWVRRASAVGLLPGIRRRLFINQGFETALTLHPDREDLIHKAVGWLLRELSKVEPVRVEQHLLTHRGAIPRTTVRYALERFPVAAKKRLLAATKGR